jgi:lipoteichoic acid synthase
LPGNKGAGIYTNVTGQMDFFPTLMELMGAKGKFLPFGRSMYDTGPGAFHLFRYYTSAGSFIEDNHLFYLASNDGKFEHGTCYDAQTEAILPVETCRVGYEQAIRIMQTSNTVIEKNLDQKLYDAYNGGD